MKKVYINEASIRSIKEYGLLPDFIFRMVKDHKTSLGDNEAFPKIGEYPFDYMILKKRFDSVSFHIKRTVGELDEDSLMSELSSLVTECKELEEPIKDSLEKLAENSINRLFAIPEGTVNMTFKLVGTVKFKNSPRITPESDEDLKYSFKDIADIDHSNKAVEKRRFINSLIQGGARRMLDVALSSDEVAYADLGKLNPHLITLYKRILYINDYLLFTKPEKLDDKKPMQGSYVETHLGSDGDRSTIEAQGIIFPLLLQEAIKGIFELFSSHGLPSDKSKAMYVIKKADYILAEPWDMRFGPTLWDMIFGDIRDSNLIPYAFTNLIKLPMDEFNSSVREILANTETGKQIIGDIINASQNDSDYQEFSNRINARNMEKSVIADSYFTAAELDGLEIDGEEENVIEENNSDDVDYIKLIENATVDNIDFNEGRIIAGNGEELILTIKGIEIPTMLVSLVAYLVGIEVDGKKGKSLNLHISLAKGIQRLGLGTKIYTKMVYEFGSLYSWDATRSNKEHIGKIFERLSHDPKIDVREIHNKKGSVDYLAVLKGQDIFEEESKRKGELITEGWSKDKQKIIERTVDIIKDNVIGINSYEAYVIENKIADKFFHANMSGNGKIRKYEPMAANILTSELGYPNCPTNDDKQKFLQDTLSYMWNFEIKKGVTPSAVCNYDKTVQMDDFESLVSKYKPLLDELDRSGISVDGEEYDGNTPYEIIPITDFGTANKWGKYSNPSLPLCYTTGEGTWNSERFGDDGRNKCFLLLNQDTWKNWGEGKAPEPNDKTPYDDYGLSMVWLFIEPNGNLHASNTRWNHKCEEKIPSFSNMYGGTEVDKSFDKKGIEKLLKKKFLDAFGEFGIEERDYDEELQEFVDEMNEGVVDADNDTFSIEDRKNNVIIIRKKDGSYNNCTIVKKQDEKWVISKKDFWMCEYRWNPYKEYFPNILLLATVGCEDKMDRMNIIDTDCNFMLPDNLWCTNIQMDNIGINKPPAFKLTLNSGAKNYFMPGKGLLFENWAYDLTKSINDSNNYIIERDGTFKVYDGETDTMYSLNEAVENYTKNGVEIPEPIKRHLKWSDEYNVSFIKKYRNIVKEDGELLSKAWFTDIDPFNGYDSNLFRIELRNKENIITYDGRLLYNAPFTEWPTSIGYKTKKGALFNLYVNNDYFCNILTYDGNVVFKGTNATKWPERIEPLRVIDKDFFIINRNTRYNVMDEDFNLLWNKPENEWFDYINSYALGTEMIAPVEINGKSNFFSIGEQTGILYDVPVEEWFDELSGFENSNLLTRVKKGERYNFLSVSGDLFFPEWDIVKAEMDYIHNTSIVTNSKGMYNIVNLELERLESDDWFYYIEDDDDTYKCYDTPNDETNIFYDAEKNEFFNKNGKYYNHDFGNYSSGTLEGYAETYFYDRYKELIPGKLYDVFDASTGTRYHNLLAMVNDKPAFLLPRWVRRVTKPMGNAVVCKIGETRRNIFNLSTLSYVFDKALFSTDMEREDNLIIVSDGEHFNLVDDKCNVLLKRWPTNITFYVDDNHKYHDGIMKMTYEDGVILYNFIQHGFVSRVNYDRISIENDNSIRVTKYANGNESMPISNVLNENGEPIFDDWFYIIFKFNDNGYYFLINKDFETNESVAYIGNINTGEYISDNGIYNNKDNGKFGIRLEKNGKVNFLDLNEYSNNNIGYLLPQWADSVTDFNENGEAIAVIGGKEYILNCNGEGNITEKTSEGVQ